MRERIEKKWKKREKGRKLHSKCERVLMNIALVELVKARKEQGLQEGVDATNAQGERRMSGGVVSWITTCVVAFVSLCGMVVQVRVRPKQEGLWTF